MIKRITAAMLLIILLVSLPCRVFACDKDQTETYVTQILFGDNASLHASDPETEMLLDALYICSEQSDNQGQEELDSLSGKVNSVPLLKDINLKQSNLTECSHKSWEYEYSAHKSAQIDRKKLLKNTVNKVFRFGILDNLFSDKSKSNSFAALLYYFHILADYLGDDPNGSEAFVKGRRVAAYNGTPYNVLKGNIPDFSSEQKQITENRTEFEGLDSLGRCGTAFAVISKDTMPPADSRQQTGMIKPSGWNQKKYDGFINTRPPYLFHRCHLIAHMFLGNDSKENLITGTVYLNEVGMAEIEQKVRRYFGENGNENNHVLYRATPCYKGDNLVASGVQIEAYSVEDNGQLSINVYCYNVQPGITINYATGESFVADTISGTDSAIPFAEFNANDSNPDLIYEINRHMDIVFKDLMDTGTFIEMKGKIDTVANRARVVGNRGETRAQYYAGLKNCEYEYLDILKTYIPLLLEKEEFFKSAFQ